MEFHDAVITRTPADSLCPYDQRKLGRPKGSGSKQRKHIILQIMIPQQAIWSLDVDSQ